MSEPVKRGNKYRHTIQIKGERHSGTFKSKSEARIWAADLLKGKSMAATLSGRTVKDILSRYELEVSAKKDGKRWEVLRLKHMAADEIGSIAVEDLCPADIAQWRDDRLATILKSGKPIKGSSVRREMNLLNHALSKATKEWGWLKANPSTLVDRPKDEPPRSRTYSAEDVAKLLLVTGPDLSTVTGRVGVAFEFAIQTGMRAGEIVNLLPEDIYPDHSLAKVMGRTVGGRKSISAKRDVPLSNKAMELLASLPKMPTVFGMRSDQLDPLFRKMTKKAGLVDATFHDTRHTACTWLATRLDVMPLAKMMGIRDLKTLQSVYYNPNATDLAAKLN